MKLKTFAFATLRGEIVRKISGSKANDSSTMPSPRTSAISFPSKVTANELQAVLDMEGPGRISRAEPSTMKLPLHTLLAVRFDTPGSTQNCNKFVSRQFLPSLEHTGSGVKPRPAGQVTPGETGIDDLRVVRVRTQKSVSRHSR